VYLDITPGVYMFAVDVIVKESVEGITTLELSCACWNSPGVFL
jgi:hypothetical protein